MERSIRILGIQFRRNPDSRRQEQASIRRELGDDVQVAFVDATDAELDWKHPEQLLDGYDGVILGGSGEFDFDGGRDEDDPARAISYEMLDRLTPLFSYVYERDMPLLGICYGHQIFGAFAGVRVYADAAQKKTKTHTVRIEDGYVDDPIFERVGTEFGANYGHKDVLAAVPDGAALIACAGETCRVSGLRYGRRMYTFQFHPELSLADMRERLASSPSYLPEGAAIEELFQETEDANRILRNFASVVRNGR